MYDSSVRRSFTALALTAAAISLVACEDKRVQQLDTGISRDSAVSVIAQEVKGSASDSFPNVYSREQYLTGGKHYEVLYFAPNNEKAGKDSVPWKNLTPLVFVENKLVAKGWTAWDSIAKATNIPIHAR